MLIVPELATMQSIMRFDNLQDDPRWSLADPICTFFFAILVLFTTRLLLREVADILMERVPRGQSAEAIQSELQQVECTHFTRGRQ